MFYGTVRAQVPKNLISQTAGLVGDTVITTREVQINHLLEQASYSKQKVVGIDVEDSKFKSFVTGVVLEWVVYKEAIALQYGVVDEKEIDKMVKQVRLKLAGIKPWQKLQATNEEIRSHVERKIRAKTFIQFKANSSIVPITDTEALQYYQQNRSRFGSLEFAQFKDRIIKFLTRQQVDQRLKSWFQVLRQKYKVKNIMAEL